MVLAPHTARGNIPRNIEEIVDWITGMIEYMCENDLTRAEPRKAAVDEWADLNAKAFKKLLSSQIVFRQTGVNQNVENRNVPRILGYNDGAVRKRKKGQKAAVGDYQKFDFRN